MAYYNPDVKQTILENNFENITSIKVDLYGSLSLTGKGHATDLALILGLAGQDPEYIPVNDIQLLVDNVNSSNQLHFGNSYTIPFNPKIDINMVNEFYKAGIPILSFN